MVHSRLHSTCIPKILLLLFLANFSNAQIAQQLANHEEQIKITQPFFDNVPFVSIVVDDSTPLWAKKLYERPSNINEVEQLYIEWRKTNPDVKTDHTRNYKHYKAHLVKLNAIHADGAIVIPSIEEQNAHARSIEEAYARSKEATLRSGNAWTAVGPFGSKVNGVFKDEQANIFSVAIDASNTNVIYVGTEQESVFKSTDEGATWACVSEGLALRGPMELEIQPGNTAIVYLGTIHGVYKTTNGGTTWSQVYTETNSEIFSIIIDPNNTNNVLACGALGYYRSTNGGTTWTKLLSGYFYDLRFKSNDPNVVLLLQRDNTTNDVKLLRSSDGGATFTTVTSGWTLDPSTGARGGRMTTSDNAPDIFYAFTGANYNASANPKNGVYIRKSIDAGLTWTVLYNYNTPSATRIDNGQGFYDWDIEMSDIDPNVVLVGSQGYVLTTDGFATTNWASKNPQIGHLDLQEALFIGGNYWVANDGGLIKYNADFSAYTTKSIGINATTVWGFDQGWNRNAQVITAYHNNTMARTDTYPFGEFLSYGGGEPRFAAMSNPNPNKAWSKGLGGPTDGKTIPNNINAGGNTGNFKWNIDPNGDYITNQKSEVEVHPNLSNTQFTGSLNQVWKTTDFGTTWSSILTGGASSRMTKIEVSKANPNVIFAAEYNSAGYKLHKSTNGGLSFTALPSLPVAATGIFLSLDHTNENIVFVARNNATTNDKVYKSVDGGMTWASIDGSGGLPTEAIEEIVAISGTNGGIYAIAEDNVYYRNNTNDWQLCNSGLPANCDWKYMEPFYKENKIMVAGIRRGIYTAAMEEVPTTYVISPTINQSTFKCSRDTAYFDDFSNIPHAGTTWHWTITPAPLYIDNANIRNPKVLFGSPGTYNATMEVTVGSTTYTKPLPFPIIVESSCNIDPFALNACQITQTSEFPKATFGALDTLSAFTLSFWVRPDTQLISNPFLMNIGPNLASGMAIRTAGTGKKVSVNLNNSGSPGSVDIKYYEWNHVAVSYSVAGSFTRVYVNGVEHSYGYNEVPIPAPSLTIQGYKGIFDEIALYNRALTKDEIRLGMHLTKNYSDPSLIHYYQFNEATGLVGYDKIQNNHMDLKAQNVLSRAPCGPGTSSKQTITTGGIKTFTNEGLAMTFPTTGTIPNGDLVVTRLLIQPETLPTNNDGGAAYWAVNNYGTNSTFAEISSATFTGYGSITSPEESDPSQFGLYKRRTGQDFSTWAMPISSAVEALANPINTVKFTPTGITSFSQLYIAKNSCEKEAKVGVTADSGPTSLRALVAGYCSGDTIYFDAALNGDTIRLNGSQIPINKSIVIKGSGVNNTIISGETLSRVFHITNPLAIVCLEDITITKGANVPGSCILNAGTLCLKNVIMKNNNNSNAALQNNGECTVWPGVSEVRK